MLGSPFKSIWNRYLPIEMKHRHKKNLLKVNNKSIKMSLTSNQFKANVFHYTETSQLVWIVNHLNGFFMLRKIGLNGATN